MRVSRRKKLHSYRSTMRMALRFISQVSAMDNTAIAVRETVYLSKVLKRRIEGILKAVEEEL